MSNFEQFGGLIYDRGDDGRPTRWKCGFDDHGRRLDPPDVDGQSVIHHLAHDGSWEGVIANQDIEAERNMWQEL